jgi:hypothetical protein
VVFTRAENRVARLGAYGQVREIVLPWFASTWDPARLAAAAVTHLPDRPDRVTPHVPRHFCAPQLYLGGMDLVAIQQTLGHVWVATTS